MARNDSDHWLTGLHRDPLDRTFAGIAPVAIFDQQPAEACSH